jgi:uncharacterized protein YodC (DUF2158 family)
MARQTGMKIEDATIGALVQLNGTPEDGPTMTVLGAEKAGHSGLEILADVAHKMPDRIICAWQERNGTRTMQIHPDALRLAGSPSERME